MCHWHLAEQDIFKICKEEKGRGWTVNRFGRDFADRRGFFEYRTWTGHEDYEFPNKNANH